MAQHYLTDLPDVCREAVRHLGTPVSTWPGWERRGRSGGAGYESGRPWCIMAHHTGSSDQSLEDYHAEQSDNAPVCNIDLKASGEVVIIAAGATNTNGKGSGTRQTSKGTVPVDSMNSYAIGIEAYNNGVGQAWPQIMIDVYFAIIGGCQRAYGLAATDVFTHEGYAPDRKVDPSTAAAVQGPWKPRSKNSSGTWNDDDLRAENSARFGGGTPPPGGQDMAGPAQVVDDHNDGWVFFQGQDGALWYQVGADRAKSLGGKVTDRISAIVAAPNVINIHAYAPDGTLWLWQFRGRELTVNKSKVTA